MGCKLTISPQEVDQVEKYGLKKHLAKPRGVRPQIFFFMLTFYRAMLLLRETFHKTLVQKKRISVVEHKHVHVRLKWAVFCSSDFEVFFPNYFWVSPKAPHLTAEIISCERLATCGHGRGDEKNSTRVRASDRITGQWYQTGKTGMWPTGGKMPINAGI